VVWRAGNQGIGVIVAQCHATPNCAGRTAVASSSRWRPTST
jgi:hypothetical protein